MSQNTSNSNPTDVTCSFVKRCAAKLGLALVQEDKSWVKFTAPNGHKICVSKVKDQAPKIDTTVDITSLDGVLLRGRDADENGRFVSLFDASAPLIEAALKLMAEADTIRPVKRAKAKKAVSFRLEGMDPSGPVINPETVDSL